MTSVPGLCLWYFLYIFTFLNAEKLCITDIKLIQIHSTFIYVFSPVCISRTRSDTDVSRLNSSHGVHIVLTWSTLIMNIKVY